jgi:type IV fimbrial biogenesis protein FimT
MKFSRLSSIGIKNQGFTIIELITVIAIIVILATIVSPSFKEIQRNSELTSATNNLMGAINTARTEAMKRSKNALVAPTTGTDWNTGITIFVDTNFNNTFDAGDILIKNTETLASYFTITQGNAAGSNFILFNASGFARTLAGISYNSTFEITRNDGLTGAELLAQTRRIKVATTGRVRSCKPTSNTDPNCGGVASNSSDN